MTLWAKLPQRPALDFSLFGPTANDRIADAARELRSALDDWPGPAVLFRSGRALPSEWVDGAPLAMFEEGPRYERLVVAWQAFIAATDPPEPATGGGE